jgi:hypothetical protein
MNDRVIIVQVDDNTRYIVNKETGEKLHVQYRVKDIWRQADEKVMVHKIGGGLKPTSKKKNNTPSNPDFVCVFRDNWNDLVRKKALTFAERGVLMSLIGFTDWRSNVLVHPETRQVLNESTLANLLQSDRKHVATHLESLNKKGLIAIVKTGNRTPNKYMMNSNLAVFGKTLKDPAEHGVFNNTDWKPIIPIVFKDEKDHSKIKKK